MPTVWTAGHNMPGYLPEGDVVAFETRLEAMQYTVEELHRVAELFYDVPGPGAADFAEDYQRAALSLEGRDAEGGDWYDTFEDGRIAYWFMSVDMTDEEAREALEGEQ